MELCSINGVWKIPSGTINYTVMGVVVDRSLHRVVVKATCTSTHAELGENIQRGVIMQLEV